METFLKKGLDNDNYLPEGTIQILGVPFQSNSDSDSGVTHAIHATPDCSFMLYELIQCYLKKNFQVITVMSNKSPTHYLAAMKKMRINYTSYALKGQLSYLDLFSAPFEDLDFTSVPLSDTCPPTFDPAASFKDLMRVSFDSDSEAITNLTKLAKEVQK